jgi:enoyl reductase-like protein
VSLHFFSHYLARDVLYDELGELSAEQLDALHGELAESVNALDSTMATAKAKAQATGVELDRGWVHRVATKKRIVLKFAAEVNSRRQGGTTRQQRDHYNRLHRELYRAALLEEFDEAELLDLEREVVEKTRAAYAAWIASTDQRMWFVP